MLPKAENERGTHTDQKLSFAPLSLTMKDRINKYLIAYGEGSCQHSFASMYCLYEKYCDSICELDGWLLIRRDRLCTDDHMICLSPIGDHDDTSGFHAAIQSLLDEAHREGKKLQFLTVTERTKERIRDGFPGSFTEEPLRNYSEYLYRQDKLADMDGARMTKRKRALKTFMDEYGERLRVEVISTAHIEEIRTFQTNWMESRYQLTGQESLVEEHTAILRALHNFKELDLRGIVLYIDDVLCGYLIGSRISEDTFDNMFAKADMRIPNICTALYSEGARICGSDCNYINWEEDLGEEGLRGMKTGYRPDELMLKYAIREVRE